MALEEARKDDSHNPIESSSLFAKSQAVDGLPVPSRTNPSSISLRRSSSCEPLLENGLLQKRRNNGKPRLPSFRGLGISSFESQPARGRLAQVPNISLDHSGLVLVAGSSAQASPPRTGSTPLLTPPAELEAVKWNGNPTAHHLSSTIRLNTTAITSTDTFSSKAGSVSLAEEGAQAGYMSLEGSGTGHNESHQEGGQNSRANSSFEIGESNSWLDQSVGAAGEHIFCLKSDSKR
jgi:hypothetical protein